MISPPSSSRATDAADSTAAFELLHPEVREWIWTQGWQRLRTIQAQAVAPVMAANRDVILSAATASGKTEAAWFPICSTLALDAEAGTARPGAKALYVGPLKALINDQYDRLRDLCAGPGLPVYRRHGDVTGSDRTRFMREPDGILLITPESLEALFVNQGTRVPVLLGGLRYVVIDELHSFIGSERGAQLQSLLHRVELAIRRRVPRIALSATIADTGIAADFLRPGHGRDVTVIAPPGDGAELQMILRGYVASQFRAAPEPSAGSPRDEVLPVGGDASSGDDDVPSTGLSPMGDDDAEDTDTDAEPSDDTVERNAIAENIYTHMRGKDNLVFANSRQKVEIYTDILTRMCEARRVPNEFFAHHGNLSKDHREDVERKLKSKEVSATAICTSTLEMGIDIGSADAVGQIGAPASVSALRQRLGRSGRRGGPAILRMYVTEGDLSADASPIDQLRVETMQAVAVIELLLERWYEPPNTSSLHLSTLIQQILSVIAQHGGASAAQLFSALCAEGPFGHIGREMFLRLLRDLGTNGVIAQAGDGTLLPGETGEKLVNHYTFYAAFETSPEYRLVAHGRPLGSMPILIPIEVGSFLLFGGRRWKVIEVDHGARVISLVRARGARPPNFDGVGPDVADGIRRKMRALYGESTVPAYLSAASQGLLNEGRTAFRRLELDRTPLYPSGTGTTIFPWRGDRIMNTLGVTLRRDGLEVDDLRAALTCRNVTPTHLHATLSRLAASPPPDPVDLARNVLVKEHDKHDRFLGEALLTEAYAARSLDVPGTWEAMKIIVGDGDSGLG